MRGRKPKPTAMKMLEGNPGRRPINGAEPKPPTSTPTCPAHLSPTAKTEWKAGDSSERDRAADPDRPDGAGHLLPGLRRWVEAERKLAETPPILKTPAGYIQISPWITISNKQVELMAGSWPRWASRHRRGHASWFKCQRGDRRTSSFEVDGA